VISRLDHKCESGMTLVELITSVAIMSVLAVACGSAVVLATRAMDLSVEPIETSCPSEAADRIVADMQTALTFTECADNAVTFTVPDRDGDGLPETLRYAWSGDEGDPLTLTCNDGQPVVVATDVRTFSLSYLRQTPASATPQVQETEEMALITHDDAPGGTLQSLWLKSNVLAAQYFEPALPANALSWKITRAVVRLKKASTPQILDVQIRTADTAQRPTDQVLEQVSVFPSQLTSDWQWRYVSFSSLSPLDPASGLCIVVTAEDSYDWAGAVEYEENGSPMTPDTHWLVSYDTGNSWTNPTDSKDMRFYIYGTVTTLGEPQWE